MASIYLVRHGQASFGQENYDQLSALGHDQARLLGESFADKGVVPSHIYAGNMLRHQQTQLNCLQALGANHLASQVSPNWNEFDHQQVLAAYNAEFASPSRMLQIFSKAANPNAEFITVFQKALNQWIQGETQQGYTESWQQFIQRVQQGLAHVVANTAKGETSLVFTSGGVISVVVMLLLAIPEQQFLKLNMNMANCGVTKLKVTKLGPMLQVMNDFSCFEKEKYRHLLTFK
ncbi:histidine phosphatase family protein [Colwellia sp. MEBiC06753]